MEIKSLSTENFRNLAGPPTEFHPGLNLIVGDNGQGKTSLLEAIAFVAGRPSFRTPTVDDVVSAGEGSAVVAGRFGHPGDGAEGWPGGVLGVQIAHGRRSHFLNGEKTTRMNARKLLPSVFLTAEDLGRITGSPSARRAALDRVAWALDSRHGLNLRAYETARASKTRLLGMPRADAAEIAAFGKILAKVGAAVAAARRKAVARLDGAFCRRAAQLRASFPDLSLRLQSDLPAEADEDRLRAALDEAIAVAAPEERRRGRCLAGPHRDDVGILSGETPVATRASSGENRTLVLAWTLAEADVLGDAAQETPLVAFDDFDSEWDPAALDRFAEAVPDGTQLFLTSARPEAVRGLPLPAGGLYRVSGGRVRRDGILGAGRAERGALRAEARS